MYIAITFYIFRVITDKSKDKAQKLSGYRNQCLHLQHASIQHLLIWLIHYPIGLNNIDGRKKQQFPYQGSPTFRDPKSSLMFPGTDLVKVKTSQFHNLGYSIKLSEVADFTYQPGHSNYADSSYGKNASAIGDLCQTLSHLFSQIGNKLVVTSYLRKKMLYLQKNALLPLINPNGLPSRIEECFRPFSFQLAPAHSPDLGSQGLKSQRYQRLRIRISFDKTQGSLCSKAFHDGQKLRKDNKYKILNLIYSHCSFLQCALSCLCKPSQVGRSSFWNNHGQCMAKRDDISNNPWDLFIRLIRRIPCKLLNPFAVHRIDLNKLNRFPAQIMKKRLCVWSGRFKANYNIFKILFSFKLTESCPKLVKILYGITKWKWLNILAIWRSKVCVMGAFSYVQSRDHRFCVDKFNLFRFTVFHGYAPLLIFAETRSQLA